MGKYIHTAKSALINFAIISIAVGLFVLGMALSARYGH